MAHDVASDLLQVLQDERHALLSANLNEVETLLPRKEAALASLLKGSVDARLRQRIDRALHHNQQLLLAVRDGIANTLEVLRRATIQPVTVTYGPDGQRKTLQEQGIGLSRKF
jgi:flagellar biosynthesis/type III secretory pathway chaperone